MRRSQHPRGLRLIGTIRRRLLVNALVDPDEAATRLPEGLRPRATGDGTVVGCCLLEVDAVRPAGWPAALGSRLVAAAHRISVDWQEAGGRTIAGVYVPVRHTDARVAVAVGGRGFPGVHERAHVDLVTTADRLTWESKPLLTPGLAMHVTASDPAGAVAGNVSDPVGVTCLGATVGLSPGRRGRLEAARMEVVHQAARAVTIEALDSPWLDGFTSRRDAPSYLVQDVAVTWSRATVPDTLSGDGRTPAATARR